MRGSLLPSLLVVALAAGAGHSAISDSLVAFYPFAGSAADSSGNGLDGVLYSTGFCPDRFAAQDSAALFGPANSYIGVSDNGRLDLTSAVSVSVWVRRSTQRTEYGAMVYKGRNEANLNYFLGFNDRQDYF